MDEEEERWHTRVRVYTVGIVQIIFNSIAMLNMIERCFTLVPEFVCGCIVGGMLLPFIEDGGLMKRIPNCCRFRDWTHPPQGKWRRWIPGMYRYYLVKGHRL